MQEDKGILSVLLLSALPFGMYNVQKNADFIDRDFVCHPKVAAKCFPVQADIRGGGNPNIMLMGRKGQLVCLDIFDKRANNQNALVCAGSGYGKSFLVNYIVFNYYASGAIMRIIDIGGSYRKLCNIVDGKFVNFRKDANICLNPFTFIRDINDDIGVLSAILNFHLNNYTKKIACCCSVERVNNNGEHIELPQSNADRLVLEPWKPERAINET